MAYDNIMKALGGQSKLTPAQEVENYSAFSDLQKQGIYIPDLMKKVSEVDELRRRIDEMDRSKSAMDEDLFAVMEQAVRSEPSVKEARQRMISEKSRVISELCMADEGFRKAMDDYRNEVNRAYVSSKEDR